MNDHLFVVTVLGKDKEGLVSGITKQLAKDNVNIVDIEQSVIHGLFSMFMLVDISKSISPIKDIQNKLHNYSIKQAIDVRLIPFSEYDGRKNTGERNIQRIIIFGKDMPGIVASISMALSNINLNIERIKMIARGDLLAMELFVDSKAIALNELRNIMGKAGKQMGIDVIVQPKSASVFRKMLIVFDMDGTIIDEEILDEMAKKAGIGPQVSELTAKGMRGEIDFEESLKKRVSMLKGLPESVLKEMVDELRITPGTEDLISALKNMGYKVALISGGFTYFTDALKERLGFDYAFGNELVIQDGKVTGELKGDIIDSERKAAIMEELADKEGLQRKDIVAVGDGANDRIMLENAGLGIAFNAKDVLKNVADGSITKNNLKGLLYCLGASEKELKQQKQKEQK